MAWAGSRALSTGEQDPRSDWQSDSISVKSTARAGALEDVRCPNTV